MGYKIEYYCISHIGKLRKNNQDNFFCNGIYMDAENDGTTEIIHGIANDSENTIFGVFDGMGGEQKGEMAAYIAVKSMAEHHFSDNPEIFFEQYCTDANSEICSYTTENALFSMGTTMATLLFQKNGVTLCNVGDSKIFLLSGNDFQQISFDHVAFSINGKKAPLTQNLGIPETELVIAPYIASGEYHNKDVYLICSDGLTDMVDNNRIKELLETTRQEETCDALLHEAIENGGKDNITIILLYIKRKKILGL